MLRLAGSFIKKSNDQASISLLHLSPGFDLHKFNVDDYEHESFLPVQKEAENLGIKIETIFKASQDIEHDIIETANSGKFDLIIAGKAHSFYEGSLLGNLLQIITRVTNPGRIYESIRGTEKLFSKSVFDGPTRRLVRSIRIPTGIFIDNNFDKADKIFIPVYTAEDVFMFSYAGKLAINNMSKIKILDFYNQIEYNEEMSRLLHDLKNLNPDNIETVLSENIYKTLSGESGLLLISTEGWHKFVHDKKIPRIPPALIIKHQQV